MNGRQCGFTLVELIAVMVLIGILAIAALPRFFDQNVFEARGFSDETRSLLRYAQKTAVAQRRTVCVALTGNGVGLTITSMAGSDACDTSMVLPNNPRGGTGLAPSVANFQFRSTGATNQAANVSITVAGVAGTITVDSVTGHVF